MNLIKILLVNSLVMLFAGGYAQCSQKIELDRTKKADAETHGEFKLEIRGDYDAKLLLNNGAKEKEVKSFSGTGKTSIFLTKLFKDNSYKVVLTFRNEEKFLCRRKVVLIPVEGE